MKITHDGIPEFFWGSRFWPICGHWFWKNNYGAKSFCERLGYPDGHVIGEGLGMKYTKDAIRVGKCYEGEELESCTGGCNDKGVGNGCAKCAAGENVKISIRCKGHTDGIEKLTCKGNNNIQTSPILYILIIKT